MLKQDRCEKCGKLFVTPGWEEYQPIVTSKIVIDGNGVKASIPFVRCNECYFETPVEYLEEEDNGPG